MISLPGRGGLDLNLSLHYNSLQWVRYGSTMYDDPDWRTSYPYGLATGFNMGFPEIKSGYLYETIPSYGAELDPAQGCTIFRLKQRFGEEAWQERLDRSETTAVSRCVFSHHGGHGGSAWDTRCHDAARYTRFAPCDVPRGCSSLNIQTENAVSGKKLDQYRAAT